MSRKRHDGVEVAAGVDQVFDPAAPEVVYDAIRKPDRGARTSPRLPKVADRLPVPLEGVGTIEPPVREAPFENHG
jgi:hypothetical protein